MSTGFMFGIISAMVGFAILHGKLKKAEAEMLKDIARKKRVAESYRACIRAKWKAEILEVLKNDAE